MITRTSRWKGPELDALRVAYVLTERKVAGIAADFHTSPGHVCRLVKRHGWKRRGYERLPEAVRQHWKWYRKLQAEYGRAAAIKAIAKAAASVPQSPAAAPATGVYVPVAGPIASHAVRFATHGEHVDGGHIGAPLERERLFPVGAE